MKKPDLTLKIYRKVVNQRVENNPNLYPNTLQTRFNAFEKRNNTTLSLSTEQVHTSAQSLKVSARWGGVVWRDAVNISVEKESWYALECWAYTNFEQNFNDIQNQLTQRIGITIYKPTPYTNVGYTSDFGIAKIGVQIDKEANGFGFDNGWWVKLRTLIYTNQETILPAVGIYYIDNRKKPTPLNNQSLFIPENAVFYLDHFSIKKIDIQPQFELLSSDEHLEVAIDSEDVVVNKNFADLQGVGQSSSQYSKIISIPALDEVSQFFSFFHQTNQAETARKQYKGILCCQTIPLLEGDIYGFESYSERKHKYEKGYYNVYLKEKQKSWVEKIGNQTLKDLKYLDFQEFSIEAVKRTFQNNGSSFTIDKPFAEIYSRFVTFAYFLYGEKNNFPLDKTIDLNELRPHFFIKPLIQYIFNQAGFQVSFEGFTNSNEFRDLVYVFNQEKFVLSENKKKVLGTQVHYFTIANDKEWINTIIEQTPANNIIREYKIGFTHDGVTADPDNFRHDIDNLVQIRQGRIHFSSDGKYRIRLKILLEYGLNDRTNQDNLNKEVFLDFEVEVFECDYIELYIQHFQNYFTEIGTNQFGYSVFSFDYLKFAYSLKGGQKKYVKVQFTEDYPFGTKGRFYEQYPQWAMVWYPEVNCSTFERNVFFSAPSNYLPDGSYTKSGFLSSCGSISATARRARVLQGSWVSVEAVGEHKIVSGGNRLLKFSTADYLPEMTQIDFLKAIASLYDLVFETNETTKNVRILTLKDYIQSLNVSKDWTEKLDEVVIYKKPFGEKSSDYLLSYEDSHSDKTLDLQNQLSQAQYKTDFGADVVKDEFSNGVVERITEGNVLVPTAMMNVGGDLFPTSESFEIGNRVLRYLGMQSLQTQTRIKYGCSGFALERINGYPALTFNGLNYRTIGNLQGLRERFWQTRLDLLKKSVVMEAWFWLDILDILNVDFGTPIKIDNDYFLLQKIKDFPATLDRTTKVELLRLV